VCTLRQSGQVCSVVKSGGVLTVSGLAGWDLARISLPGLAGGLVLPGFQDGCKETAGENGSEQRTWIRHGGWGT
jgi:hypothetical protein